MATIQPIKTNISIQRKLSIAVGLLSFAAFIIQGLSTTWGGINLYFLGSTTQKISEENKKDESNK